ncbi:MAG: 23S rRNA (guanosine(2251)-2'-O)-methyltransferase RlmB [Alphaproteobacteria bacterium]|nr:23S rRNA (guanosine(2251)-2'-O)-methyltransferase RlmB [Alphaproteobacteria bacterium]
MSRRKRGPHPGGRQPHRGGAKSGSFDAPNRHPVARPGHQSGSAPRDRSGTAATPDSGPDSGGRQGAGDWLYGLHAVAAALANPARRWHRLIATPEGRDALSHMLGPDRQPAARLEILARDAIDRLLPAGAVHQGIAVQVTPLDPADFDALLATAASSADAILMVLDQVTDPHNVGAILRSAAAFGARAVVVPERHAPRVSGVLAKAASGAVDVIPLARVVNLSRALRQMKEAGFWCIGLDAAAAQTLAEADLSGRIALVLGAEGEGLRRLTRETCDATLRLPTQPPISSLNVSNAAAVALYELARRRATK